MELNLPKACVKLGQFSFQGNQYMKAINVEAGNPVYTSSDGVLYRADMKSLLHAPGGFCGNKGVYHIPNGVENMAYACFNGCDSLIEVSIPESVTYMETSTFNNCHNLRKANLPSKLTELKGATFCNCEKLEAITIPAGVKKIGLSEFQNCMSLTSIVIPDSCESLYSMTFQGCTNLKSVKLGKNLQKISQYNFNLCDSLKEVTIPKSLVSIMGNNFTNCKSLQNIYVEEGNTAFYSTDGVLFSTADNTLMTYPIGKPETNYTIPTGTKIIGSASFQYHNLENITLPAGVVTVKEEAFANGPKLKSLDFGPTVENISGIVAYECPVLESVIISPTTTNIGKNAFNESPSITSVVCNAKVPPTLKASSWFGELSYPQFMDDVYAKATLYTPQGTEDAYREAAGWQQFKNIQVAGVASIEADEAAATWYTLDGRVLDGEPTMRGLYIKKTANSVKKVAVQ